jgi:hypothetical protein
MAQDNETPQEYCQEVLRLVHCYKLPPPGFVPLAANERALFEYGLPPRPTSPDPEQLRFWELMLGDPIKFTHPEFPATGSPADKRISSMRPAFRQQEDIRAQDTLLRASGGHLGDSKNWSGAIITPDRPNRFVYVAGMWTVPTPKLPHVAPSEANRLNEQYRSSTWIGIGGDRPYNSLPQIGTSQTVVLTNGTPRVEIGAWWQWWVRNQPKYHVPIPITNFPVSPGDEILASLTVEAPDPGEVQFHFKNRTTGSFVTFKVQPPRGIRAVGSTAEWIHERPTRPASTRKYPLPKCTDVVFKHCLARSTPRLGEAETTQRLDNPRLVRMYETFEEPHRTAYVSVPVREGRTGLRIAYREAGS